MEPYSKQYKLCMFTVETTYQGAASSWIATTASRGESKNAVGSLQNPEASTGLLMQLKQQDFILLVFAICQHSRQFNVCRTDG